MLTLFCKDKNIIQATAKKLLSFEDNIRFDTETGLPIRNFYKPANSKRGDYHCERFPSTYSLFIQFCPFNFLQFNQSFLISKVLDFINGLYVNPNEIWCNQKNPISNKEKLWQANTDDDPVKLMLNHITSDSWFTLHVCDVPRSWVEKAAEGKLNDSEFLPGKSRYLRLINDTAERLVKAAEDTNDAFSVFHKSFVIKFEI